MSVSREDQMRAVADYLIARRCLDRSDEAAVMDLISRTTDVEVLEWVVDNVSREDILTEVAANPESTLGIQHKLLRTGSPLIAAYLARVSREPGILDILSSSEHQDVIVGVAGNVYTRPEILDRMLVDHPDVAADVGLNPSTFAGTLRGLSRSEDPDVRVAVAENPSVPLDSVRALAVDTDTGVRAGIAKSLTSLPEMLVTLASDPEPGVRAWVANSPVAPVEALEALAGDTNTGVLFRLAGNANTPFVARRIAYDNMAAQIGR